METNEDPEPEEPSAVEQVQNTSLHVFNAKCTWGLVQNHQILNSEAFRDPSTQRHCVSPEKEFLWNFFLFYILKVKTYEGNLWLQE